MINKYNVKIYYIKMEIKSINVIGTYFYKPDIDIKTYKENYYKECVICKRLLVEPSYEIIIDNKKIKNKNEIVIGKCGHMYHGDCMEEWLKNNNNCPIDNVKWCFCRVVDTTTKQFLNNNFNKKKL